MCAQTQKANCVLGYVKSSMAGRVKEGIPLFETSPEKAPRGSLTAASQYSREPTKNLERNFSQEHVVIGQLEMALS